LNEVFVSSVDTRTDTKQQHENRHEIEICQKSGDAIKQKSATKKMQQRRCNNTGKASIK
jgi:hypothetical protein